MNKLEGKYNKEERGEGFFSAMFSKQSSYDTFHCNDVKSSNVQTTAQEEVIDMQDLAPEDDNTEDPYHHQYGLIFNFQLKCYIIKKKQEVIENNRSHTESKRHEIHALGQPTGHSSTTTTHKQRLLIRILFS